MGQQIARVTGIFGRNEIGFPEDAQGAQGDVLQVADRGRNNVKSSGQG
jgi:hypothetical protein